MGQSFAALVTMFIWPVWPFSNPSCSPDMLFRISSPVKLTWICEKLAAGTGCENQNYTSDCVDWKWTKCGTERSSNKNTFGTGQKSSCITIVNSWLGSWYIEGLSSTSGDGRWQSSFTCSRGFAMEWKLYAISCSRWWGFSPDSLNDEAVPVGRRSSSTWPPGIRLSAQSGQENSR